MSEPNQQRLRAPLDRLVRAHDVLRAIPANTAHLTLAFMTNVPEPAVATVTAALRDVARSHRAFEIVLSAPQVLRARRNPRLVLLPVSEGASHVQQLAEAMHEALTVRAPGLEIAPSKAAHVTLARFRKTATPGDGRAVEAAIGGSELSALTLGETVGAVHLMVSSLGSAGAEYRTLATSVLESG